MNNEENTGLSLETWLKTIEMSYSEFARLVPCHVSYPRMIAKGTAWPSYKMAKRIEEITDGAVPRIRWYPPGEPIKEEAIDEL